MLLKKEIVDICRRVYAKGFVAAYDGNISALTPEGTVLITRSALCKGEAEEKDILEINLSGELLSGSGKISTENKMHLFIYNNRKDVKAVIHCHPVFATAFASSGRDLSKIIFPEVLLTLGKIHLCKYATPSTNELTDSMQPYIKKSWALLLQNHGAVTMGTSIKDAYYKMEKLEHSAKTIFIAELLGGAVEIPEDKIKKLLSISEEKYGILPDNINLT